ncbi:hypothetical protein GKZ68_12140 [Hymenobacter sp. BRD128]|uniref:hypothetical protein n=1 Tax=Hymenobacter sp. BRD128 TaxID=2675878 RepID=UPI001566AE08|nr:hypothetical protein [Hymenobacter sp. BRD128]QKG57304.1 hypothetical protein GKZ68_12140 [Hymenobacter sp. BRD128]
MKLLLLAAALLTLPSRPAIAQRAPLTAPLDSAALLHQLFKHERRIGLLGLGATTGVRSGLTALHDPSKTRQLIGGLAIGANSGLLVMLGINLIKFSRRREREAIEQLQQHQPLRPYVQKSYALALLKATVPHH